MASLDTQSFKVSIKDIVWFGIGLCGLLANWYKQGELISEFKLAQHETNTVIQMRLDNLEPMVKQNSLDIRDLQVKQIANQKFVPNTDKPL